MGLKSFFAKASPPPDEQPSVAAVQRNVLNGLSHVTRDMTPLKRDLFAFSIMIRRATTMAEKLAASRGALLAAAGREIDTRYITAAYFNEANEDSSAEIPSALDASAGYEGEEGDAIVASYDGAPLTKCYVYYGHSLIFLQNSDFYFRSARFEGGRFVAHPLLLRGTGINRPPVIVADADDGSPVWEFRL
jgi:hypothetical protein